MTTASPAPDDRPEPDRALVPGVVIDHSPASSRQYIGSPSIAALPGGMYVASHDFFGPGSTRDTTVVFASKDRGASWTRIAVIKGQWWSTLFFHRGALYLMGTSREYGETVIRRSDDRGFSWTSPVDSSSGLLLPGQRFHCAPVPVVEHNGRIWRAMEDAEGPGGWGEHFRAFMMSAPVDADLLRAESWTVSRPLGSDRSWLDGMFGGWLEGNAVVTPDGQIVDLLRVDTKPEAGFAALVHISEDGNAATFDPEADFIRFPGGAKKFTVRYDPRTQCYWSLTNWVPPRFDLGQPGRTRNTLALVASTNLRDWEVRAVVLHHPDVEHHGFQYVDWLFEGEDLIAVVRTAFDDGLGGAHNQHDANFMTFHRIENFRTLDGIPPDLGDD
ncbi:exo-alpha-sialidase [Tautonia sociabilis]|uniref:Exo-alpha-sialidase n=1 Tax=Tautonia sociabilis TaxID=2080755 RepID=A0A432MGC8_9BACT|nr:exo-alpha-sialidase [Tautonia sociabilis]